MFNSSLWHFHWRLLHSLSMKHTPLLILKQHSRFYFSGHRNLFFPLGQPIQQMRSLSSPMGMVKDWQAYAEKQEENTCNRLQWPGDLPPQGGEYCFSPGNFSPKRFNLISVDRTPWTRKQCRMPYKMNLNSMVIYYLDGYTNFMDTYAFIHIAILPFSSPYWKIINSSPCSGHKASSKCSRSGFSHLRLLYPKWKGGGGTHTVFFFLQYSLWQTLWVTYLYLLSHCSLRTEPQFYFMHRCAPAKWLQFLPSLVARGVQWDVSGSCRVTFWECSLRKSMQ